jgi:hypothetical protein
MSRRHHGRSQQGGRYRHDPGRHAPGAAPGAPPAPVDTSGTAPRPPQDEAQPRPADAHAQAPDAAQGATASVVEPGGPSPSPAPGPGRPTPGPAPAQGNGRPNGHGAGPTNGAAPAQGQERSNGCTAPQLRRFIKSRPYVPMHELRRRFAIDGGDDDVTQVSIEQGHVYVGLPSREGGLLGELLRGGEIGYELSLDPRTPVVVGVYPMRPIPRS